MNRLSAVQLTVTLLISMICTSQASAQQSDAEQPVVLSPVVVVASKSPRPIQDVAGTVHVITAEDQQRSVAQNLDQVLRYQPALNVERSGSRFGATGVNIRGIGGNRVAIEIDGVPVRDQFDVGSFSNAGRDLVETGLIRRIEILNGPASTLYGSDALGGIVAITTWDAHSLLEGSKRFWSADLNAGYHGEDNSYSWSVLSAAVNGNFGVIAGVNRRHGQELDNQADETFAEDPQDWDSISGYMQLAWHQDNGNRLRLIANSYARDRKTDIQSLLGRGRFRSTTALRGIDQDDQTSVSLEYKFGAFAGFDSGRLQSYVQTSDTDQRSSETRATSATPVQLQRDFFYQQDTAGFELNLNRHFIAARTEHQLGLGLEYTYNRTEELRDGSQTTLATGEVTNQVLGEVFPLRDFPTSKSSELGLYAHDEIRWGKQRWALIPAVRVDYYSLDPKADTIFLEDNPNSEVVSLSDFAVSPKLGLVYQIDEHWSGFAQYARGFRAPPFEDANIGLDIPLFAIRAIPNPDLKSETSDGLELGIRRWSRHGHFNLSGFMTYYNDFIETRARIGVDPDSGVLLFQSRNIDEARIYGVEFDWSQQLGSWHPALQGFRLELSGYLARGDNRSSDVPLNSVAPPQAVTGLHWQSGDGRFDTGLVATFTRRQSRIDTAGGERFASPGYGVIDWLWGWQANKQVSLRGGIFNLTDKTYWRWLDVANLAPDDPLIQILSRPGRHFAVNITIDL